MYRQIHCSNSSPILELSVKFSSQICHENINKLLDGTYLADFGIDITWAELQIEREGTEKDHKSLNTSVRFMLLHLKGFKMISF